MRRCPPSDFPEHLEPTYMQPAPGEDTAAAPAELCFDEEPLYRSVSQSGRPTGADPAVAPGAFCGASSGGGGVKTPRERSTWLQSQPPLLRRQAAFCATDNSDSGLP